MIGRTYIHHGSSERWTVIGADSRFVTLLGETGGERWPVAVAHLDRACFTLVDNEQPDVGPIEGAALLIALALVAGLAVVVDEPIPYRLPGEQPQSEFTAGPVTHGPLWTDDHLADVFGLRDDQGGAR